MGGHIDDAELTYDHPVISISMGCPCLFLLGTFVGYCYVMIAISISRSNQDDDHAESKNSHAF